MSNIVSMGNHRAKREKSRARQMPARSQLPLMASAIREAIDRRPMAHSERERLTLAQNLWTILQLAIEKNPALSKAQILHAAGQGQPHESTKRLPYFAVDPIPKLDERNKRAPTLRKHVKKYVGIASAAARLCGMNENEILVLLTQGTDYQGLQAAEEQNPYDEALADILTILEQHFDERPKELMTFVRDYFAKLVTNRLTLDRKAYTFRPNAKAWSSIPHSITPNWRVPGAVADSIPAASLGRCFLKTVSGRVHMRVADQLADGVSVQVGESDLPASGAEIELPASIEVYASVSIGVFCAEPNSNPLLVFTIRPDAIIPSENLKGVYVEKGKESDEDWEFLGLWDNDPIFGARIAATSSNFASPGSGPQSCTPSTYSGQAIIEEGHIVDLRYSIDWDADFGPFDDLKYLGVNACLIEPVSLPVFRKWLLNDMRDEDGNGIDVALPEWIAPDSIHPDELLFRNWEQAFKGKEPTPRVVSEEVANFKKMARDFIESSSTTPTSFPEGTLAAALERGLINGSDFNWGPDVVIDSLFLLNNMSLALTLATATAKRKSLLKQ